MIYEEKKRKRIQKRLKPYFSKAITSDLYLEDILRLIVTVTAEVMHSKICSLMLIDENIKELVVKVTQSGKCKIQ